MARTKFVINSCGWGLDPKRVLVSGSCSQAADDVSRKNGLSTVHGLLQRPQTDLMSYIYTFLQRS